MNLFVSCLFLLASAAVINAQNLRSEAAAIPSRQLQSYYYSTTDSSLLGKTNKRAVLDNPFKGLLTSPRYTGHNTPNNVPSTLEFYYIGLDELMTGPNKFDWTVLDDSLAGAEENNMHVVLRVFVHYPDKPLRVPQWLLDQGIELRIIESGEKSPQYDDPKLLHAFRQFIQALGAKYDGHKNLAFLQLGLLGKWGEWHTYPDKNLISDATKDKVVGWYKDAFKTTPLQVRNPLESAYQAGFGLHDDSFGFSTLDGPDNGGEEVSYFFWPEVKAAGQEDFWRKGVMGGETRPEIQGEIFESGYRAGTPFKQDFFKCVDVTHATYMFHHNAFQLGEEITGNELQTALDAHVALGYSYRVSKVAAKSTGASKVTVDVTVEQIGVAPFYYLLNLVLKCDGTTESVPGVEKLISPGDKKVFSFTTVPADSQCLNNIEILLDTNRAHAARPVRFAQGKDGRVTLSLPVPEGGNTTPSNPKPPTPPSDPSTPGRSGDVGFWAIIVRFIMSIFFGKGGE